MIKIESHIPIPKWKKVSLPLDHMRIGDSFFSEEPAGRISTRINMQQKRGKNKDKHFIIRTEGNGCRVWRVE